MVGLVKSNQLGSLWGSRLSRGYVGVIGVTKGL